MTKDRRLYWACGIAGVVLVSIGAVLEHSPLGNVAVGQIINHAGYETGIALIVAVILAATFERQSLAEFQALATRQQKQLTDQLQTLMLTSVSGAAGEFSNLVQHQIRGSVEEFRIAAAQERAETSRDIFQALYGVGMPKVIKDEMDLQFLRAHFLIRKLIMNIALRGEPVAVRESEYFYMVMEVTLRYEVENLTPHIQLFDPTPRIIKLCPPDVASQIKFFRLSIRNSSVTREFSESELARLRNEDELSVRARLETIEVSPAEQGIRTAVELSYQTITSYEHGYHLHIFPHHTWEVELNVDASKPLVLVSAQDFSGNPLKESFRADRARHKFAWEEGRPFLTSQGIYIAWNTATR